MDLLKDNMQSTILEKAVSRAVQYLQTYDENYQNLIEERNKIMDEYHNMLNYLEYEKPIELSEEEHRAMIHYLELESQIEDMIRFAIYLCGHCDCTAYLHEMNKIINTKNMMEKSL